MQDQPFGDRVTTVLVVLVVLQCLVVMGLSATHLRDEYGRLAAFIPIVLDGMFSWWAIGKLVPPVRQ